jgi:putative methionine-R-sulfoxide reductase with GAF domain
MWQRASGFLTPAGSQDMEYAWRAQFLAAVIVLLVSCTWFAGLFIIFLTPVTAGWLLVRLIPLSLLWLACFQLLRRGHLRLASLIFVVANWAVSGLLLFLGGGLNAAHLGITTTLVFLGGVLLGKRSVPFMALATIAVLGLATALANTGLLSASGPLTHPTVLWLTATVSLVLGAFIAYLLVQSGERSLIAAQQANDSLREAQERQASRIAAQARVLRTSADISRRLSTILDRNELVSAVVNQIQSAFNYYHVHVYLYGPERDELVLVGGTGEAGRALIMGHHRVPADRGLTALAAREKRSILAEDVRLHAAWLPNPLLPDTRCEAVVPILAGETVIGVLDVQQDVVGGLRSADVEMLELIAGQLAIALQNARSFEKARERARQESLVNLIGQKIQRAGTVEDVLAVAADELGKALSAERAIAELGVTLPSDASAHGRQA